MNDTLLLIGHGSRHKAGNEEIESFAKQWRQRHPDWRIEVCFIELADLLMTKAWTAPPRRRHPALAWWCCPSS
jgi:sirohydrochlorin cobaltochelatase